MKKTFWLILSLLSFFLVFFICAESFSDKFNALIANYYFKKNDINSAIKFYEIAFDFGLKDSTARQNYINLIINAPLDIPAQEHLEKFIEIPIDDGAKNEANAFLSSLRYQIHKNYPDNYIYQCTYNQKIIRWSNNEITYGYTNPQKAPEYYIKEIDNAFLEWEKALDNSIHFVKTSDNPDIVIRFNSTVLGSDKNEKYIAATTQPVINSDSLKNMITDYYLTSPDGNYYSDNQIFNTALHEIGHELGIMGHSDYRKNVMYMSSDYTTLSDDSRKTLTNSDINTIKLLYKIKPDITDKKQSTGEYTRFIVFGGENEVANAKIREAKIYINKTPNLPLGYIDLADAYMGNKEYRKALKCLNKALMIAKDNDTIYTIYYNLALVSYYISDYENAKAYLEKSGNMKNSDNATRLLAEIYTASGAENEAIALYEVLISKYPSDIEYTIALANIYVRRKNYLKARAVLKNYISQNPAEKNNPRLKPYGIIRLFF